MGRIIVRLKVENIFNETKQIDFSAMVDTDSTYVVLPNAWRERLGNLEVLETVKVETATQSVVSGDVGGPVKITIEGFRPVYNEVMFLEMSRQEGEYEPLLGYVVMEQSRVAVDMLGHRLIEVKRMDLK